MRFVLLVLSPPDLGSSARHALKFAEALAGSEHSISCVFFFDAGVLTAAAAPQAAQDEDDLRRRWSALARERSVKLVACVASAQRFGVSAEDAAAEGSPFDIAGLGELIEATSSADRVVSFRG
jgi:tRNA 2-thiouridine synthesizing protein D